MIKIVIKNAKMLPKGVKSPYMPFRYLVFSNTYDTKLRGCGQNSHTFLWEPFVKLSF